MSQITRLNPNHIVSVKSTEATINPYYVWKDRKRILFFWERKEGFYMGPIIGSEYLVTKEFIESQGRLIVDKKVYNKPCVTIYMIDGKYYVNEFDNRKDRDAFLHEVIDSCSYKWIYHLDQNT